MKEYFNFNDAHIVRDVSVDDIIAELEKGNIMIVPVNGQVLKNNHYTPPGPLRHMLVLIGYDYDTKEFITNDPGTRFGGSYRYSEENFFESIDDYQTGKHLPRLVHSKNVIVVERAI